MTRPRNVLTILRYLQLNSPPRTEPAVNVMETLLQEFLEAFDIVFNAVHSVVTKF